PTLPSIRTYSCTSRSAALTQVSKRLATSASAPRQPQLPRAQLFDAVANLGGLLEFEVARRGFHLRLEGRDVRLELTVGPELLRLRGHRDVVAFIDARQHFVDALYDRRRGDAGVLVVG